MKSDFADRLLALVAVVSLAAVGVALVSQHVFDMQPCAWCILQRMVFIAIAVAAILGLLLRKAGVLRKLLALVVLLLAAGGVGVAYYQYAVTSKLETCAQTFADRFVSASGLDEMLPQVFGIYGSCADAVVDLLGVRYELWSIALYALAALAALIVLFTRRPGKSIFG